MIIRPEQPEDFPAIYELVKVAFQTAKVSNGKEQDFVNELRAGGNYIPELALVVEEDGEIIGHILLTRIDITTDSRKIEALYVAPLSVLLEHRGQGIGSALIEKSFDVGRRLGFKSVILVGDPAYYHRFGFKSAIDFGIKHQHEIPNENVMACELLADGLAGISGSIDCC